MKVFAQVTGSAILAGMTMTEPSIKTKGPTGEVEPFEDADMEKATT